ncbi:MAG: hypothetical protein KAT58_04700 [candidate division Zixibacteria bacterium]|nr:hypothetical protein [candidate division Zixibacteria bacterium]
MDPRIDQPESGSVKEVVELPRKVSWKTVEAIITILVVAFGVYIGFSQWKLEKEIDLMRETLQERILLAKEGESSATAKLYQARAKNALANEQLEFLSRAYEEVISELGEMEVQNQALENLVTQKQESVRDLSDKIDSLLANLKDCEFARADLALVSAELKRLYTSMNTMQQELTASRTGTVKSKERFEVQRSDILNQHKIYIKKGGEWKIP